MAKTVAAAGRYPYGICGFLIQNAVLKDGTILKDARIQKQRNSYDFDIRADDGKIYSSLRITGFDKQGVALDYNKTDDELAVLIKPGNFYVRSMNENGDHGFAIKFFDNKVILADGRHLYNLVPPTCTLPKPALGTIVFDPVLKGDTVISAYIIPATSAGLNTKNMFSTVLINGTEYTAPVNPDGTFSITVPSIQSGTYVVTVTSEFYQTTSSTLNVIGDDDSVLSFFIPGSSFTDDGYIFNTVLPGSTHNVQDFIIQTQYSTGQVYTSTLIFNDSTKDITLEQVQPNDVNVLLLSTDLFIKDVSTSEWIDNNGYYSLSIPGTEHGKQDNIVIQISEKLSSTEYKVSHQSISVDENSNITIEVINPFDAKIIISGT